MVVLIILSVMELGMVKGMIKEQREPVQLRLVNLRCTKGHEYTEENTLYKMNRGTKERVCKICSYARDKISRDKRNKRRGKCRQNWN